MATKATTRPGRTLAVLGGVIAILLGLVVLGGDWAPRLGLDLQGGTRITLQARTADGEDPTTDELAEAQEIISSRVNGSGVSAAEVSTRGGDQIIVEIPGEQRSDIVKQIGRTAQLRFRLVWSGPAPGQQTQQPPQQPPSQGGGGNNNQGDNQGDGQGANPGNGQGSGQGNNRGVSGWMLPADDTGPEGGPGDQPTEEPTPTDQPASDTPVSEMSVEEMLQTTLNRAPPTEYAGDYTRLTAEFTAFTCPEGDDAAAQVDDQPGEALITCDRDGLKYLLSPAVIEGTSLTDASAGLPQATPQWVVNLELDGEGSDVFSTVTRGLVNTQQLFAIVLDGQVLSAPRVTSPITNGQAQISGGFTQETATDLANSLQYGALPLTFDESGVTLAGPTLAKSQLAAGVLAGLIGLALVVVYCMFYYRGLGLVVIASLAVAGFITYELVLLLGASVGFTLTLPGIAGLIVAVGITADSFIVFFERLRDEVREGKSLRLAVEAGWRRARLTILAADAVSLLAAVVLYIFAIDEIRGFAFALGLTTAIDVLVVFFFTKPLVSVLARTKFFGQGHPMSGLDARHLGVEGRKVSELAHGARRPARVPR